MKKKAFLTGISGQDSSYLAEYLLDKNYEVYGMIRRHSVAENQQYRLENIRNEVKTFYGDMTDQTSIEKLLSEIKPDEIYNLAAQSHVRISFDIPQYTVQTNALGVINILEAYKRICPEAKFYQASSSEMFGNSIDPDGFQRETTKMDPVSPYGCSKVFGYNIVRHYRRAYGLHACNGILFNHESPRRGSNFVTSKVVKGACMIKLGMQDYLELGNLDSHRDWGHSKDYCIDLETKILTKNGYKFRDEVAMGDTIINLNIETGKWEEDIINNIYDVEYDGIMYNFNGNGINFRCSENHRIIYQRKSSNSKNWGKWKEATAHDIYDIFNDISLRNKYNYRFPGFTGINKKDYDVDDNMLILLGYLVTEGYLSKSKIIGGGMQLSVSQSNKKYLTEMLECINNLNLDSNIKIRKDNVCEVIFNSKSRDIILEYFEDFDIHKLPSFIYELSFRQSNLLYKTMMNCDGCWSNMLYISKNYNLANQFSDVANYAGYRTKIKQRKSGIYDVTVFSHGKKSVHNYITSIIEEKAKENIWCITAKNNQTIITKKNDSCFISGNCRAMHMIINHDIADDFVVSTMETHSIREMCEIVFNYLGMDYRDYVIQNPIFLRPEELSYLKGDSTKIRTELGWKPYYKFEEIMIEMIEHWMKILDKNN